MKTIFSFYSLNRFFTLSLNKIGCTRKCKEKQVFFCHFSRFTLSLNKIGDTSTIKIKMAFYFALSSVCTIFE